MKNFPCYTINTPVEARNGGNAIYESLIEKSGLRSDSGALSLQKLQQLWGG